MDNIVIHDQADTSIVQMIGPLGIPQDGHQPLMVPTYGQQLRPCSRLTAARPISQFVMKVPDTSQAHARREINNDYEIRPHLDANHWLIEWERKSTISLIVNLVNLYLDSCADLTVETSWCLETLP
jgi:hypothetical protein